MNFRRALLVYLYFIGFISTGGGLDLAEGEKPVSHFVAAFVWPVWLPAVAGIELVKFLILEDGKK